MRMVARKTKKKQSKEKDEDEERKEGEGVGRVDADNNDEAAGVDETTTWPLSTNARSSIIISHGSSSLLWCTVTPFDADVLFSCTNSVHKLAFRGLMITQFRLSALSAQRNFFGIENVRFQVKFQAGLLIFESSTRGPGPWK